MADDFTMHDGTDHGTTLIFSASRNAQYASGVEPPAGSRPHVSARAGRPRLPANEVPPAAPGVT